MMIAVPCWSSWKTGMSSSSRSRSSTSKQAGAPMSSRLMPPKVGASGRQNGDHLLDGRRVDLQVEDVDVGEPLEEERLALHDRLGGERAAVAEPEDGACRW